MATRPKVGTKVGTLTANEAVLGPYDAIVEAPNVEACLKRAAMLLSVSPAKLDHIVLDQGVSGLLGSVSLPYRCRVYRKGAPPPVAAESVPAAPNAAVVNLPQAARVRVELSDDKMLATLAVTPPAGAGADVTVEQLREALKKAGVTTGIDSNKLKDIADKKMYFDVHVVAQGLPGRPSRDARIEFKVQLARRPMPKIDDQDNADFHDINLVESVCTGQVLAVKQPKDDGLTGQDVTGATQLAPPAKDVAIVAGKNVMLLDDGVTYAAGIDGQVKYKATTLSVEPVLEIAGDVDYHTGNLAFLGTVIIRGSVLDNFTVRASQDIIINGSVGMSQVEAEGNVQVRGGIMGKESGLVRAGGTISAKFVENAKLRAERHVIVSESVLHSQVDAGHTVALTGKKAILAGGRCRAGHAIYAKEIGLIGGALTAVEVGLQLRLRDRIKQAEDELNRQTLLLNKVVLGLRGLLKIKAAAGRLPPEREQMLQELNSAGMRLKEKVAALGAEIDTLREELTASMTDGKIAAQVRINPRVQLTVGRATLQVTQPIEFSTVRCEQGEIVLRPYEKPNLKRLLAGQTDVGDEIEPASASGKTAAGEPARSVAGQATAPAKAAGGPAVAKMGSGPNPAADRKN